MAAGCNWFNRRDASVGERYASLESASAVCVRRAVDAADTVYDRDPAAVNRCLLQQPLYAADRRGANLTLRDTVRTVAPTRQRAKLMGIGLRRTKLI